MRKQQYISQGLQTIDEDFESDDDDETQGKWINQQTEHRDREDVPPIDQQRRLGLDIDMIGAREENLGSTRSQTLEMRSPSNQAMERANVNMDNWIQETWYMSAVTSEPDEPNNFNEAWIHQSQNERRKWREAITKRIALCGKQKGLENHL